MGPSLCILAARSAKIAGTKTRVIAVSRYSDPSIPNELRSAGVEVITADLLDDNALLNLPNTRNVIYMAGRKFGTTGNEGLTWAMNTYLPGRVVQRFATSRIVAFSTGNVYPYVPISSGGAQEDITATPVGEYGMSCLGRERMFEYFSQTNNTPVLLYRLSYAIDMRYGVLHDIAEAVWNSRPIHVGAGVFTCIWQGDANEWAIRSLDHCHIPAAKLNATGPETLSIRSVANEFGKLFGKPVLLEGRENDTAMLASSRKACGLFGNPSVPVARLIGWTADWVASGGIAWDKPTHFEDTKGSY